MIEHFPVGRRLAFDAGKGRLWVVCPACQRWNLTPLEERWEAIEEAERIFRDTRTRFSSDNIGLARARDGLELVRVGKPLRPEFAAWRYGAQFLRRRRNHLLISTGVGVGFAAVKFGSVALGGPIAGLGILSVVLANKAMERVRKGNPDDVVANVQSADDWKLPIRRAQLGTVDLVPAKADRWGIRMDSHMLGEIHLVDAAAIRVLGLTLAQHNPEGAKQEQIDNAVAQLAMREEPEKLLPYLARQGPLDSLSLEQRLALEMAVNEDAERRALEGELRDLELAWKDAEEIASIADNMFLPAPVNEWIRKRRRVTEG